MPRDLRIPTILPFLLLNFFFLYILGNIELYHLERDSYFSDSQTYFEASKNFPPHSYHDGYYFVYFLSFLRSSLPYMSALLVIFLIYSILAAMLSIVTRSNLISLLLFHPFVFFIFIRGLKESLIAIVIVFIALLIKLFNFNKLNFVLLSIIFAFLIDGIRPMGFYFVLFALVTSVYFFYIQKTRKNPIVFISILLIFIPLLRELAVTVIPRIGEQIDALVLSGYEVEHTKYFPVPLLRFIFGPTPVKPILDLFSPLYEFSTALTLFVLFMGSVLSIFVFYEIYKIRNKKIRNVSGYFGAMLFFFHASTYILIQDGSVDTRQRALSFLYLILYVEGADS